MPEQAEATIEKLEGKILIIDDEPDMLNMLADMLANEGFDIDKSLSGKEGLELYDEKLHDLVLTDQQIGDITGIDVLRHVKKKNNHTAVVLITGYASTESTIEAIKLGACDYLTKPVLIIDLIKTVRTHLTAVKQSAQIDELNQAVAEEADKLRHSIAELTLLKRLAERMMSALSFDEGFELILKMLVDDIGADIVIIFDLATHYIRGNSSIKPSRVEIEQLASTINSRGKKQLDRDIGCSIQTLIDHFTLSENESEHKPLSIITVPLLQEGKPFCLLTAASRNDESFERELSGFITKLSQDASDFLSRIKLSIERQQYHTAAIVENSGDGIIVIDPVSGETMLNPVTRNILKLSQEEDQTVATIEEKLEYNFLEDWKELKARIDENILKPVINADREITRQGEKYYYNYRISVLPSGSGGSEKLLIVIHDKTKERSVEEMKNRLMSNITHEVRTPTAVVKEFTSLILDGVAGDLNDTQRQYMQLIQLNIDRLARLIDSLLTLARADSGGFSVVLQPTSLITIIENVTASMKVKFDRKDISISFDLPSDLPLVFADKDAVTQILTNLLDNAFKYSPENTEVKICVLEKGTRIQISIIDQGYGIAPSDQKKIFTRFHRLVDQNDSRFQEGIGLGLSLVKDFVARHGGDIWVESEVGVGSVFYFSLQIAQEDEEHKPA
ncbi:MAG: response regulator [Calditrichaeota bacterium]|nr:response regulator [Calditrichota bacterium]